MAKDSELYHLSSDIQKIQVKTNMYLQEFGKEATAHLGREAWQNCLDELLDDDSNGTETEFIYDRATGISKFTDNGRSFNESKYPMETFCSTLQSGYLVALLSK